MEFHDVGKHCAAESCRQQDFLPFTCNGCSGVFCLEHRTHAGHDCPNANFNDKRVVECKSCKKVLESPPGLPQDAILEQHLASGCVESVRKIRSNKLRCSAAGCRASEFVKVSCKSCAKNFCFRHRHEEDHKCPALEARAQRGGKKTAGARTHFRIRGATSTTGAAVADGGGCSAKARAADAKRASKAHDLAGMTAITPDIAVN